VATIDSGWDCALGVCLVTENAFAAGTTAMPGPRTDQAWDGWILHRLFQLRSTGGASVDFIPTQYRTELDSKAMRIAKDNMRLVALFETSEHGSVSMSVTLQLRLLSALH